MVALIVYLGNKFKVNVCFVCACVTVLGGEALCCYMRIIKGCRLGGLGQPKDLAWEFNHMMDIGRLY